MNIETKQQLENFIFLIEAGTQNLKLEKEDLELHSIQIPSQRLLSTNSLIKKMQSSIDKFREVIDGIEEETRLELAVRKFIVPPSNPDTTSKNLDIKTIKKFMSRFSEAEQQAILASVEGTKVIEEL